MQVLRNGSQRVPSLSPGFAIETREMKVTTVVKREAHPCFCHS